MASAPTNPYLVGPPIDDQPYFFGREDILQDVEATLRQPGRSSVILYGQRRVGKSSLLKQLESRLADPPLFTVYIDLAGKALLPADRVLYEIATTAAAKANMAQPAFEPYERNPAAFDELFLPALYQVLGGERRPVFLLDEFEALDAPAASLPLSCAVRALGSYVHDLLKSQSYAAFVFTAGRRMEEITNVVESDFEADLARFISVLSPEETHALIWQEGATGIRATYNKAAIRRILRLTRGHPYLTQFTCHLLYERAHKRSRRRPRVTLKDVDAIAPRLTDGSDDTFPLLWESLRPVERLILSAMASTALPGEALNEIEIINTLNKAGISPDTPGLRRAPDNLVSWQVLELSAEGFRFFLSLMEEWVSWRRPFEQVKKEELENLDPAAVALFLAAQQAYRAGHGHRAAAQLHQALALNPNHLQARLLLGTILQEQGQVDEAVDQFEVANKLDPASGKPRLVAALLQLGASSEKSGVEDYAVSAYERVLAVSPGHESAVAGLQRLGKQPAEQLLATDESGARRRNNPVKRGRLVLTIIASIILLLLVAICTWVYVPIATQEITTVTAVANMTATDSASTVSAAGITATAVGGQPRQSDTPEPSPSTAKDSQEESPELANPAGTVEPVDTPTPPQTNTPQAQLSGQIVVAGSRSMQPVVERLAQAFITENPQVDIVIQANDSNAAIQAMRQGTADVGMVSRPLEPSELATLDNVRVHSLAEAEPIVIIGHILVPVDSLSLEQIRDIYRGTITNWGQISPVEAPIVIVSREEGAESRATLERVVGGEGGVVPAPGIFLEKTTDKAVRDNVSSQPYAIGYVPRSAIGAAPDPSITSQNWQIQDLALLEVKVLALDQIEPSLENAAGGTYPLTRPLNLLTEETPGDLTAGWLEFITSAEGQEIIERTGQSPTP